MEVGVEVERVVHGVHGVVPSATPRRASARSRHAHTLPARAAGAAAVVHGAHTVAAACTPSCAAPRGQASEPSAVPSSVESVRARRKILPEYTSEYSRTLNQIIWRKRHTHTRHAQAMETYTALATPMNTLVRSIHSVQRKADALMLQALPAINHDVYELAEGRVADDRATETFKKVLEEELEDLSLELSALAEGVEAAVEARAAIAAELARLPRR